MAERLVPLTLFELARRVNVHPLEVAAILGYERPLPAVLCFGEADVAAVASQAPLRPLLSEPLGIDDQPRPRALFRNLLHELLAAPAGQMVRLDNAFRGLDEDDARKLRAAVDELVELGVLRQRDTLKGATVAIGDPARAHAMRDGNDIPEMIEAIWV